MNLKPPHLALIAQDCRDGSPATGKFGIYEGDRHYLDLDVCDRVHVWDGSGFRLPLVLRAIGEVRGILMQWGMFR